MPRGRPKKEIDKEVFENLCELQCTRDEICAAFDIAPHTLLAWCKRTYKKSYSEVYKLYWDKWNISLRRLQRQNAESGNPTMQIWLGKVRLGQSEKSPANVAEPEISEKIETLPAEFDEDVIRQDLLDQLRTAGLDTAVNRDLVEDYVSLWVTMQWVRFDIRTRGPVITYNNGGGQSGTKENPSLNQQLRLGNRMEKILKQLGLSGENAVGGDDFDGL